MLVSFVNNDALRHSVVDQTIMPHEPPEIVVYSVKSPRQATNGNAFRGLHMTDLIIVTGEVYAGESGCVMTVPEIICEDQRPYFSQPGRSYKNCKKYADVLEANRTCWLMWKSSASKKGTIAHG